MDVGNTWMTKGEMSLAQMQGKPVWLVFMATWCTGCRTEMPDVQGAIATHASKIGRASCRERV